MHIQLRNFVHSSLCFHISSLLFESSTHPNTFLPEVSFKYASDHHFFTLADYAQQYINHFVKKMSCKEATMKCCKEINK